MSTTKTGWIAGTREKYEIINMIVTRVTNVIQTGEAMINLSRV